jgi:N-dimethylarginine dimethylaminohydrolase
MGETVVMSTKADARFLMCSPDHFGVTYAINPWMDPKSWACNDLALTEASHREWTKLCDTMREHGATIELVPSAPGLPDLVFTANAAVVLDRKALLARFRHPERQREETYFEAAFRELQQRGLVDAIIRLPDHLVLEGAGDCVWDQSRNLFWMGYGPRSDATAREVIAEVFDADAIAIQLADPRFYHMDTALCPLPRGEVMFVPSAFTGEGKATIYDRVEPSQRIEVGIEDACQLAANTVCIGGTLVMSDCGDRLRSDLTERGYDVVTTPLHSFLRSGGAAFCLTLRLDRISRRGAIAIKSSVAA